MMRRNSFKKKAAGFSEAVFMVSLFMLINALMTIIFVSALFTAFFLNVDGSRHKYHKA